LREEYSAWTIIRDVANIQYVVRGSEVTIMTTSPSDQQPGAAWRKARASIPKNYCVEALVEADTVHLRDSKGPQDAHLRFGRLSWAEFLGCLDHSE
jgi:hypothetical protein